MVAMLDLESSAEKCMGSSPILGTIKVYNTAAPSTSATPFLKRLLLSLG